MAANSRFELLASMAAWSPLTVAWSTPDACAAEGESDRSLRGQEGAGW